MSKAKRILGVLLISGMVLSMIPGSVFADEGVPADSGVAEEVMESAPAPESESVLQEAAPAEEAAAAAAESVQTAEEPAVISGVQEAEVPAGAESISDTAAADETSVDKDTAVADDSTADTESADIENHEPADAGNEGNASQESIPAERLPEDILDELIEETDADEAEEEEEQAVRTEYIYEDGTVKVTAYLSDAAAIPDEAYLAVTPVTPQTPGYNYDAYMAALNEGTDFTYDATNTFLYDYAFMLDGVEVQPAFGEVTVVSEFRYPLLTEYIGAQSAADISLIHMPLTGSAASYITTQEAVNIQPSDIARVGVAPDRLGVDLAAQKISFRTSSFSVWAIVNTAANQQTEAGQEEIAEEETDESVWIEQEESTSEEQEESTSEEQEESAPEEQEESVPEEQEESAPEEQEESVPEEQEEESEKSIGFADSRFVRILGTRYMLNVSYGEEAGIPADAQFIAVPLSQGHSEYAEYEERAANAVAERTEMLMLFDLTIFDADGAEVTPQAPLTITMFYGGDIEEDADVYAVHFVDTSAAGIPTADGEAPATAAEAEIEVIAADTSGGTATFDASGFSVYAIVYTVDFEYEVDGRVYQFSINGGTSISLRELLVILGVIEAERADAFVADIDSVVFSNPAYVEVVKIPGDWMLNSLQAFSTEESLTVTMKDGSVFEIRVTDLQGSQDITDFLYNAVVTGATQDSEG
ncbi:MAG: hypothetical protein IKE31_07240, partial [Eubacterium sp.]|nr:hypothetical protein [Eubacterium sp.]